MRDVTASVEANGSSAAPRLRRVLSLWDLIFYGIVLIQPIAPFRSLGSCKSARTATLSMLS
jgi:hypothetical protein